MGAKGMAGLTPPSTDMRGVGERRAGVGGRVEAATETGREESGAAPAGVEEAETALRGVAGGAEGADPAGGAIIGGTIRGIARTPIMCC